MEICSQCTKKAVIKSENGNLCRNHFLKYFKSKFYKTIKNNNLINEKDVIAVGFSGGKDSTTMLYLLNKYCCERKIKLFAILIDEGIKGYRPNLVKYAKKFCKDNKIKLYIFSYKKEFGSSLDSFLKKNPNECPCTVCGIFRRYLLNKKSRELSATKLAIGHNMDDESQTLLLNIMQNKPKLIARSGIDSGAILETKFVKRIKPLFFLKEKEIMLFSIFMNFKSDFSECPYTKDSMRHHIRKSLNELSSKFIHLKSNIINAELSLVEVLRPYYYDLSNNKMKNSDENIKYCEICGEVCAKSICNACKEIDKIHKK